MKIVPQCVHVTTVILVNMIRSWSLLETEMLDKHILFNLSADQFIYFLEKIKNVLLATVV